MDLFKFNTTNTPTILERGQPIKNYKSAMWTERYREAGEFEIVAQLSTGIRDFLPTGTLIGNVASAEFMIVENQEIKEDISEDAEISISGRSFETFLENRIVGQNFARQRSEIWDYTQVADNSWQQAVNLISDHISGQFFAGDGLANIAVDTRITGTGTREGRIINRGTVYERAKELAAIDDCGIRNLRINPSGWSTTTSPYVYSYSVIEIYKGVNRADKVIFSWKEGDLDTADYLFTNKTRRTTALVVGRWIFTIVDIAPTAVNYYKRMMIVDANDIDGQLNALPTGATLTTMLSQMQARGRAALANHGTITIGRTDVSENTRYHFRRDYNIGDLVSIDGNFGQIATMRVVEHVEIEDENGSSSHPTLSSASG